MAPLTGKIPETSPRHRHKEKLVDWISRFWMFPVLVIRIPESG